MGQGQWATLSESQRCWHFDMGGERAPWRQILRECRNKEQWVSFSHWDWDHMSFLRHSQRLWPQLCLYHGPLGSSTPARHSLMDRLRPCSQSAKADFSFTTHVREVQWQDLPAPSSGSTSVSRPVSRALPASQPRPLKSNELSRIFVVSAKGHGRKVLLPGDSYRQQERIWAQQLRPLQPIHILVLGHHGSRTSTSQELLQALPHLELGLISARRARYNHPHPLVIDRLRRFKKPWISTEDFGHLRILLEQRGDTPFPNPEPQAHSRHGHYRH